jgi:hypothetical protein
VKICFNFEVFLRSDVLNSELNINFEIKDTILN